MTRRKRKLPAKKIVPVLAVLGVAIIGYAAITTSRAATFAVASEAEAGTRTTKAAIASDSTASGGSAVKFGTAATGGGGGVCNNPIGSVQDRDTVPIPGTGGHYSVRNEAWNDSHGPQTTYACTEKSWYTLSNQPDLGGAVQTYPDSSWEPLNSKTLGQYTSITSTFGEAYDTTKGDWNAGYDLWFSKYGYDVMIWNEWHGGPSFWPTQATTAVTLGGVPYHFYNTGGGELIFFRDTQVKSGSVDILAAYKWLIAQGLLSSTDSITQIDYG
ncbi:MAG TPA: hypothetical protein VLG47_03605, partial [Candidatus Saccharimonadales bacterium]|nr:hypothetical protein [Candidatus Saccharimonadales bacterium]